MNRKRFNSRWLLAALPLLLTTLSPVAVAGGDRHFSSHGYAHSARHGAHRDYGRRHYRHRRHHYRHYNGHYNHRYRHRHGHRSKHHSNRGAYLVGGLIAGSLLTHALTRPRDHYSYSEHRTTRVVSPAPIYRPTGYNTDRTSAPSISRRLFRDRDGNCFERSQNSAGEEVLIELPAASCAW